MLPSKQTLIKDLAKTVQYNCHIADACHAGDFTLCVYLLKMREFYRWEQAKTFSTQLPNEDVGQWLRNREQLWDDLQEADYQDIEIDSQMHPPLESERINEQLRQHQLVYGGGMGLNNRPHFFLADLDHYEQHDEYSLYISGKEYARDMSAPPAMSLNSNIYIREESFRRLLWEKLETWRWNRPDNALGRAFACYDCENDLDTSLDKMTKAEVENVIQHERGEIKASELLGKKWELLLYSLPHSKLSLMLRAIRDHLADSLTTLPALLDSDYSPSWHFYFGNLTNIRKDLSPALSNAYEEWHRSGSLSKMTDVIERGKEHWLDLCQQILSMHDDNSATPDDEMIKLIEQQRL